MLREENPPLQSCCIFLMVGFQNYFCFPFLPILPSPFQLYLISLCALAGSTFPPLLTVLGVRALCRDPSAGESSLCWNGAEASSHMALYSVRVLFCLLVERTTATTPILKAILQLFVLQTCGGCCNFGFQGDLMVLVCFIQNSVRWKGKFMRVGFVWFWCECFF